MKRKWLLQCIVEPAARNVSGEIGIYCELPDVRTCEVVQSALILSLTGYETSAHAKMCPGWIKVNGDMLGKLVVDVIILIV